MSAFARAATAEAAPLHKCTATSPLPPAATGLLQGVHSIGAAAHTRQDGVYARAECCSAQVRVRRVRSITACMRLHTATTPLLLPCCRWRTASARQDTRDKSACTRVLSAQAQRCACGTWAASLHACAASLHVCAYVHSHSTLLLLTCCRRWTALARQHTCNKMACACTHATRQRAHAC